MAPKNLPLIEENSHVLISILYVVFWSLSSYAVIGILKNQLLPCKSLGYLHSEKKKKQSQQQYNFLKLFL
jgi:hypothetical protein